MDMTLDEARETLPQMETLIGDAQPSIDTEGAVQEAEQATGGLNGAQTQSLIAVIGQYAAGTISEGQAINIISVAIGVSKEEAKTIIEGAV